MSARWTRGDGTFRLDVDLPANTTAQVHLPTDGRAPHSVGSGRHTFTAHDPLTGSRAAGR
ncbi:alpha-L-rhamnosidase C-terminal domain-containing protein [Streptomyces sp. WI04-05B]|nr:alpha-L-rhamnosidase C-terminal domain-containing protein [Streptomyces sp. WI04-05B]MDX2546461.1 alpha-L-rhamnosidase C-terminal domain-containing protein [Streptomyces sp. WI04-05B]MDX2586178.1 alpha-L-rhamnosidase C-terminal domain-containing protein [Streptomyces sp. WI04-05A]MDX3748829.1 alpha-L-rhamnosidase C-terminal domain-containing protein [Streptomyces sp. AK08-02]